MPQLALILLLIISAISLIFPKITLADSVVINEFLAHTSSGTKEWVEFYNSSGTDISSYFLDDDTDFNSDAGSSTKKSLSGYNSSNSTYPYLEFDSFLNNSGDYVVIFDSNGQILDQYQYTDDPGSDTSIGRSPDRTGSLAILSSSSKGSQNSPHAQTTTPTASPNPTTTAQTSYTKSPTPSPKASPTPAKSPFYPAEGGTPTSQITAEILGKKEEATQQEQAASPKSDTPSPTPQAESSNRTKVASYLAGSGLIVIGLAVGLFLWTKRRLKPDEKPD